MFSSEIDGNEFMFVNTSYYPHSAKMPRAQVNANYNGKFEEIIKLYFEQINGNKFLHTEHKCRDK